MYIHNITYIITSDPVTFRIQKQGSIEFAIVKEKESRAFQQPKEHFFLTSQRLFCAHPNIQICTRSMYYSPQEHRFTALQKWPTMSLMLMERQKTHNRKAQGEEIWTADPLFASLEQSIK